MKSQNIRFVEFITLVALLMSLVSITINMLLPAFQEITSDFYLKDKNQIHLSISLLYLGLGISQLFYGSLSDSIGRHIAGLGASIVGPISTLISVPLSILIGSFYDNSTVPIAIGFFMVGILSTLIFNFINPIHKNEKHKRLSYD